MRSKRRREQKIKRIITACVAMAVLFGSGIILRSCSEKSGSEEEDENITGITLMLGAKKYINNDRLRYDDSYFNDGYPPDDVGVCTDVVWKAFEAIDVDIRDLIDWDIENNYEAYADLIDIPDTNIDFRIVDRQERYFQRNAEVLDTDVTNLLSWMPGDIVTYESSHVAIISCRRNIFGYPYVIQHGRDPAAEEDRLFGPDVMEISGHFRWKTAG